MHKADYPEHYQKLINSLRSYNWEKAVAKSFVTADEIVKLIDYPAYFKLTKQNLPANKKGILERLSADNLIKKDVGGHWNITNLGRFSLEHLLPDKRVTVGSLSSGFPVF